MPALSNVYERGGASEGRRRNEAIGPGDGKCSSTMEDEGRTGREDMNPGKKDPDGAQGTSC